MDRRLDKRYLTGAVSAMEKQYGAEKTDAIIEDAWRRYAEIVDENADEPKKMYMHTLIFFCTDISLLHLLDEVVEKERFIIEESTL